MSQNTDQTKARQTSFLKKNETVLGQMTSRYEEEDYHGAAGASDHALALEHIKIQTSYHHFKDIFERLLKRIFYDDLEMVQDYHSLLLLEVLKLYDRPDGMWQLEKALLSFDEKPQRKEKHHRNKSFIKTEKDGPLKILIVSGMFPCTDHGGGLRLFDIVRELCKDHSVDIFAIYNEELEKKSYDLLRDKLNRVKLITEEEMVFENLSRWVSENKLCFSDYDFVQFEFPHTIPLISQAKKYGAITGFTFMECQVKSFAIYIYNMIMEERFLEFDKYVKIFWGYLLAEKEAVEHADILITMTDEDSRAVEQLGAEKTHIIPTSISSYAVIDELEKHKGILSEENSVAFLGYYGHYPNIDGMRWYLQEIHPVVKLKIPDYKVYVIGRGDTSILEEISEGDPNVLYTGRVDSIVPPILKAKVCVLPLVNGAGIRGKINQYSIAGRPSVTTSIGNKGLKYVHGESTMLADDPVEFANHIIGLLSNEQLYDRIKRNAQKVAIQNYTWKNHIARLVDIYRGNI